MEDGRLEVVGSGSLGNAYILTCGENKLLIELGCNYDAIMEKLDYNLSNVVGALISHTHGDHLSKRTAKKMIDRGVKVYGTACESTQKDDVKEFFTDYLSPKTWNTLGVFTIMPLPVPHGTECFAYIIDHPSVGRCVFATDMSNFPYNVRSVKHLFIEANYSYAYAMDNASRGEMRSQPDKHMEINDTINVIKRLKDSSEAKDGIQTCVLLHLSNSNANAKEFKDMVCREVGLRDSTVYVAMPTLSIPLYKDEY